MGYPYYGRTDLEGRRFEDDRERWEDRDYERGQREGTRFDENRWRGRERAQGYVEQGYGNRNWAGERGYGAYGERGYGGYGERGWGRDDDRDFRPERYYPGQYPSQLGRYGESIRPREDQRYFRGRDEREHEQHEDRSMLERVGDRVREGLRRIGRGPKGFKRSDERIAEEVCERIARSTINAENVEVKVKDGEVTLVGFVEARYDKRNLEDLADDVFGVTEVHNQLRVQSQQSAQRSGTTTVPTNQTTQGRVTHS